MAESKHKLPEGFAKKLTKLVQELENNEGMTIDRAELGEIELKININDAMWFVAYKTAVSS